MFVLKLSGIVLLALIQGLGTIGIIVGAIETRGPDSFFEIGGGLLAYAIVIAIIFHICCFRKE